MRYPPPTRAVSSDPDPTPSPSASTPPRNSRPGRAATPTAELAARHIGTSVHFIPIHLHPYYRDRYGYAPQSFPVAWSNYGRLLSLPLNPRLTDDDVTDVIEAVRDVVRVNRR